MVSNTTMKALPLLSLLTALFFSTAPVAQDIAARADSLLSAYHRMDKFQGTVLIAKGGKVVFEKGYGEADRTTHRPNGPLTEFRIGSVSKPFTAILILKLQEKGLLSIQDPVSKYLPDYPKGDVILLEHLLSHTSGVKSLSSMKQYYAEWIGQPSTLPLTISRFRDEPLRFAPGTQYEYSNSNYILLSYIAEKVSGTAFEALLQQYITGPLKLAQTGMDRNHRPSAQKALGYQSSPEADYAPARFNDMSIMSGAGSLYSTARDLYRFDRALYTNQFLSAASKEQLFAVRKNNYALGWEVDSLFGRLCISHAGSIDGFLANLVRFPEQDVCIVFLSNYFDSKGAQISRDLAAITFGEAYELPKQRRFIHLPADSLQAYAGTYEMEKGPAITVFAEDGKLKGRLGEQAPFLLLPESETRFYIKAVDSEVIFSKDGAGQMVEMKMQQGKKSLVFKKAGVK